MNQQNYQTVLRVNNSAAETFQRINQVTLWWTDDLKGDSEKLNDEFSVQFGDIHYSKQKVVEMIPDKKVVWLVTESRLNFTQDMEEWTNTRIVFEIVPNGD